jgi:TPR repeat protein
MREWKFDQQGTKKMGPLRQSTNYFTLLSAILFFGQLCFFSAYAEHATLQELEEAKRIFFEGDLGQALTKFQAIREIPGPEVDYFLALIYRREGEHQDYTQALSLLLKASSKDYPPAMRELGIVYERGEGVDADLLTSLDWYRKADALEKIDVTSVRFYATHEGALVEQDLQQQIQLIKKAAAEGDLDAAYQLAKLYDDGVLVVQNLEQALHWYRIAAETGHGYSQLLLGYFLCRGIGISKNVVEANHWLTSSGRKASCSGESANELGR